MSSVVVPGRMSSAAWSSVSAAMRHARRNDSISLGDLISTELMRQLRRDWSLGPLGSTVLFPRDLAQRRGLSDGRENLRVVRRQMKPEFDFFRSREPVEECHEGAPDEPRVEPFDDTEGG